MAITVRAASAGGSGSSAVGSIATTLPTGAAAGDLILVFGYVVSSTAETWSQSAGTGQYAFHATGDSNTTVGGCQSFAAYLVMQTGDTAPTFAVAGGNGRVEWAAVALTPDTGKTITIDAWAPVKIDGAATSHTPNAAAAAATGEVSILGNCVVANAKGTTAVTLTDSSGWTVPTGGSTSQAGNSSNYSGYVDVATQTGVSGTVTPGSESTGSVSTIGNFYHVLVSQVTNKVVNTTNSSGSGASTLATTLTSTTAGNLLVAFVSVYSATTVNALSVSSVTLGGAADNWAQAYSQALTANTWVNSVWIDPNCAGGQTTSTVTISGSNASTFIAVQYYEISSSVSGYPVDVYCYTPSSLSGSSFSFTSPPSTQTDTLWIGCISEQSTSANSITSTSGAWTPNGTSVIHGTSSTTNIYAWAWTQPGGAAAATLAGPFGGAVSYGLVMLAIPGVAATGPYTWTISDAAVAGTGQGGGWGCPPNLTSIKAECWGGGGGAGGASVNPDGGSAGGGGEYAAEGALTVTPGSLYAWTQGAGGTAGANSGTSGGGGGNSTMAGASVTVTGHGGGGGGANAGTAGPAGTGSANTTHHDGGAGAAGSTTLGGGGGGSGGTSAAGNAGSGATAGSAVTGGGPGGTGKSGTQGVGAAPVSGPGGGGGGGLDLGTTRAGTTGWGGQLILTYTVSAAAFIAPAPRVIGQALKAAAFF